jgi:hypothetical protein
MRYIPQFGTEFIVQVPEDKNSYINVKNIGASGRGELSFTGSVTDISNNIVTISSISDGQGGTLFQYSDLLRAGTEILSFSYSINFPSQPNNISITGHSAVGDIDFSSSTGTNPNLAALTYYITGYDVSKGVITSQPIRYEVKPTPESTSKVLNPNFWNTAQYVQLNFSRNSNFVLPVIYRQWGNKLDFLGVIGNNKIGYPGSGLITFRDLGSTEYAAWHDDPVLPEHLKEVFSASGGQVTLLKRLTSKESFRILPGVLGQQSSFIQCSGISQGSQMSPGDTVYFQIDDTRYIREAVNLAASGLVKEVFFPAGSYNTRDLSFNNSSQFDYSSLSLRGVGNASVIKRLPCTVPSSINPGLFSFNGQPTNSRVSGLTLRSMYFDGNFGETFSLLSPITSEVSLNLKNIDNLVINECTFVNNGGGGFFVNSCNSGSITANRVIRSGRPYEQGVAPFIIDTSENMVVQGNTALLATTGPQIISTEYSTINGNIVRGCGDKGINLETSSQWNSQGNLAYSDNDSLIRSIDTYNNEYSKATIEVRKGFSLDPVFMTVTYGGESVSIARDSVDAKIFELNQEGQKSAQVGSFRVLQTQAQLDVGIFSVTLPGVTPQVIEGKTIPSTQSLNNPNGYVYEVNASVLIGNSTRGFRPFSIRRAIVEGINYIAIQLRNSSDLLGFQIYSNVTTSENDSIVISGFKNVSEISGWNQNSSYPILGIDPVTNSVLIDLIPGSTIGPDPIEFDGGNLFILRPNYFIADGNLIAHTL